jgi:hypothetical protein
VVGSRLSGIFSCAQIAATAAVISEELAVPLESLDCDDFSNSVERLTTQFLQMKKDYGARYVRIYAPQCNDQSIWANLIEAGVAAGRFPSRECSRFLITSDRHGCPSVRRNLSSAQPV